MSPEGSVAQLPSPSRTRLLPLSTAPPCKVPSQVEEPTESAKVVFAGGSLKLYLWVSVCAQAPGGTPIISAARNPTNVTFRNACFFILVWLLMLSFFSLTATLDRKS